MSGGSIDEFTWAIQGRWDEGYDLVDVEYADGLWFGTFGDNPGFSAYSTGGGIDEFTWAIQGRWDEGYDLVDVEYADGLWLGVFGTGSESTTTTTLDTITTTSDPSQVVIQNQVIPSTINTQTSFDPDCDVL